jgi:hypothetical protein
VCSSRGCGPPAGTKAGAKKARATRAAAKGKTQNKGSGKGTAAVQPGGGVGTALIAKPLDVVATSALQGLRDKAATKERLARLPDHWRQVAPQGLNRLPARFPVRTVQWAGTGGVRRRGTGVTVRRLDDT